MCSIFADFGNLGYKRHFSFSKAEVFDWLSEFHKVIVVIQNKKGSRNWSYMNQKIVQKNRESNQFIVIFYGETLTSKLKATLLA